MNSQDKPNDGNDNLEESLSTADATEQQNLDDLWTDCVEDNEIVTEFISAKTAVQNDKEAIAEVIAADDRAKSPSDSDGILDLDNWDFRNIDSSELESELDPEPVSHTEDLEVDEIVADSVIEEAISEIGQQDSSESLAVELEEEDRVAELAIDPEPISAMSQEEIDEPILVSDSSKLSSDRPSLEDINSFDNSLELDLAEESEAMVAMDLSEPDGLEDSGESDELIGLGELEDSGELSGLGELEDPGELDELVGLGEFNKPELLLDNNEDLPDLVESGLELDSLNSLDALNSGALDGLEEDLDSLLDLNANSSELDSLIVDSVGSLDDLENTLDSDLNSVGSVDLDSLLGSESPTELLPTRPPSPTPQPVITQVSVPTPAPMPAKAQGFDQTMRVSVRKLDNLNNLIGELVVKRNRLEDDQERLRRFLDNLLGHVQSLGEVGAKMHDMYERSLLEGALIASRQSRANAAVAAGRPGFAKEEPQEEGLDALEMDRFTGFHLLSQDIIELIVRVREAASDIQFVVDETDKVAQTFRQVTTQLQDGMNSSRMVAFGQTADRLPRAVRDISRKQKKQTKLHVEGKDVLIDKMIVEHIYNPMTHLVNNAISHGIEQPEVRLKRGKSESGNVYIRAFIQGNQTVITVRDDGAGIDPEIVKKKAIEKNLITWASAQNLSDQQVYELLFHPGFSTKDEADDFAGRGVGMDVVNTDLKKIRGSVSTESELGKGTTFTIRLPLVLSICKALTCVDNNTKIAFPIDGVEDTKEYIPSDIQTNDNGVRSIYWNDVLLPLRPLSGLLNYNRQIRRTGIYNANQNTDDTISVVILRSLDNILAIEVDEVKAEQEIVIKQIDGPIAKPPGIAGATVLGDGSIMPIGDVLELVEIAQGKRTIEIGFNILSGAGDIKQAQAESMQQEPMVLVVDDSITVRELLSMSFNKLGYRVEQARDGQEAWDKLRGGLVCDMIFSDIEMPRMNGLELLSNLHQDSELKSIPVAMLTSRGADKHRKIANDLGAKAYLTKPYTEKDLMDVAQHLIEINRANQEVESANVKATRINKQNVEFEDAPLVLIIDDSVTVRELLSMTFKKAGYRVEQARDGQEAWEKLSDGLECDIAFCDIEMPRMNGLELLAQLQKDEKLAQLPIAMLTSRGAQKMRNIAASRGANGYFVKPYVEDDLLKAAKQMMNGENLIHANEDEG